MLCSTLIDAAATETNVEKRTRLIRDALMRTHDQYPYLPLHRQVLTWLSRANVRPVLLLSNQVRVTWIQID